MATGETTRESRSLADLIKELRDETSLLMRQEVALAKTEMTEKASVFGRNAAFLAAGGAIAYAGALFLLGGLAVLIARAMQAADIAPEHAIWIAMLIVGTAVAAVGYALVQKAISRLKHESVVPEKTVASLQENKRWVQQKVM